jgi:hypothetical protein
LKDIFCSIEIDRQLLRRLTNYLSRLKRVLVRRSSIFKKVKHDPAKSDDQTSIPYEKGFNATLFDCIDRALSSVLGRPAASTFYFAIEERSGLPEADFQKKPLVVLQHLKEILGEAGFNTIERSIVCEIANTFGIEPGDAKVPLTEVVELARKNYIQSSLQEKIIGPNN